MSQSVVGFAFGVGECIADRYELLEELGVGGMGRVFRARDAVLGREVALKVLDADASGAPEARAAASVGHGGIASIFDVGSENGTSYIVMELVEGQTLRELLRERGPLPPAEAIKIVAQVADAMAAAHAAGLVHCDVKPQNILVASSGAVKLVDFGIARGSNATRTIPHDEIRGSAPYLSPEQVRGERVDGRTDVYALGAVLYELLTGRPPFEGHSAAAVISRRLLFDPVPPRTLNPGITRELERVTLSALARDHARRPDAAAFGNALRAAGAVATDETMRMPRPAAALTRRQPVSLQGPSGAVSLMVVLALTLVVALLLARSFLERNASFTSVIIPSLIGTRISEASGLLEEAGLAAGSVQTRRVERAQVGFVLEQQPAAGLPARERDEIQLVVGVSEATP